MKGTPSLGLATLFVVVLAACTAPAPVPDRMTTPAGPEGDQPRRWTGPETQDAIAFGVDQAIVGWDGGYLTGTGAGRGVYSLAVSQDARQWRNAIPEGIVDLATVRAVAAHGSQAYVLGWTSEALVVWRTADGRAWQPITLKQGTIPISRSRADDMTFTIAAGPRGVVVAGGYDFDPPEGVGLYIWHSPDGQSFRSAITIPGPENNVPGSEIGITATPEGFLAMAGGEEDMLYQSTDGVNWEDLTTGFEGAHIQHVAAAGATLVAFTRTYVTYEPVPYFRRDGVWHKTSLDPGRLPDAGVVPAVERQVTAVRNWGTGLIALGNVRPGEGVVTSGMVWHSADGRQWTRMPVRDNRFDQAAGLMDLAVRGGEAVITGYSYDESTEKLQTWRAPAPSR
ncbi:hypothetical protein [Saccharothrix deserti]|uniref:hypothetical protein n=1 Tax=Saccharothrix deserti TaxID=2593674 RepID=UPI00131A759B|nr:hypothetical protein [Saccharothrix deserti]